MLCASEEILRGRLRLSDPHFGDASSGSGWYTTGWWKFLLGLLELAASSPGSDSFARCDATYGHSQPMPSPETAIRNETRVRQLPV
jgi:hypothetical protein